MDGGGACALCSQCGPGVDRIDSSGNSNFNWSTVVDGVGVRKSTQKILQARFRPEENLKKIKRTNSSGNLIKQDFSAVEWGVCRLLPAALQLFPDTCQMLISQILQC